MDIAEVARTSGLPASTLRFYEERGLVTSIGRRGLRRVFDPQVLQRLALIALGRATGFSLDEIGQMFGGGDRPRVSPDQLLKKAEELDARIKRLTAMRDGLRHAAHCPAPSHMECPKFLRIVKVAGAGRLPPLTEGPTRRRPTK